MFCVRATCFVWSRDLLYLDSKQDLLHFIGSAMISISIDSYIRTNDTIIEYRTQSILPIVFIRVVVIFATIFE